MIISRKAAENPLTLEHNFNKTQQNISHANKNIILNCILNANKITRALWNFCKGTKTISWQLFLAGVI